jgi:signal transduction histidine kinase
MSEVGTWSPLKANLEQIRLVGLRARDVVRQLLTFARHNDQEQKPMNISAVVRDSLKLIRSAMPANIEIKQRLPADIDPVLGNNTQTNQLIINLCGNAADTVLPAGGRLNIEMDNVTLDEAGARCHPGLQPGAHVRLVVADTGCGMDAKTLEHIFEGHKHRSGRGPWHYRAAQRCYYGCKQTGSGHGIYCFASGFSRSGCR